MTTANAASTANANEPVVVDPADFDVSTIDGIRAYRAAAEAADTWIPRHEHTDVLAFAKLRAGNQIALTDAVVEALGFTDGDEIAIARGEDGRLVLFNVDNRLQELFDVDEDAFFKLFCAWTDD